MLCREQKKTHAQKTKLAQMQQNDKKKRNPRIILDNQYVGIMPIPDFN